MARILVIEDEKPLRDEIAATLNYEGYDVAVAENGRNGVDVARQIGPDMVVCDITMPEMDGYGVLEELRKDQETQLIPFMFLTARADKSFMRQGMELGADDYLTKPFTRSELLSAIRARLDRSVTIAETWDDHLEEAKATLTRMVAHELRTPLISLHTTKEIFRRKLDQLTPEMMAELLDSMDSGIDRLTHVVEQTIFLNQLEAGLLKYQAIIEKGMTTPVDSLLESAIRLGREFAYRNREGTIQIHLEQPEVQVKANPQALKHGLAELVANALNFSNADSIVTISQSVYAGLVNIQIRDRGVGIDSKQKSQAFKKYTQINRAHQEQQGMGLGLHVARRIVEAHGGKLNLVSSSGQGTQVTVSLPFLNLS